MKPIDPIPKAKAISFWLAGYGAALGIAPSISDADLFDGLGTVPDAIPTTTPAAHHDAYRKGYASAIREHRTRRARLRRLRAVLPQALVPA